MMLRLVALLWLLASGLAMATAPSAARILANCKSAMGGSAWDHIRTLRLEGKLIGNGFTGSIAKLEDVTTGRWATHSTRGPASYAEGFNGQIGWIKYPRGEVVPKDSPTAKRAVTTEAYLLTRAYWSPRRWPAAMNFVEKRTKGKVSYQILKIAPQGGHPFKLWINAKTHLIDRIIQPTVLGDETVLFRDYHMVHGVKVAFLRKTIRERRKIRTVRLKRIAVNVHVPAVTFAKPKEKLSDFTIKGDKNKVTMPFKLINNHIYIPVMVNGHQLHVILDSGAPNILRPQAAKQVGAHIEGTVPGNGAGKKTVNFGFSEVNSIMLNGEIKLRNQSVKVIPWPGYNDIEGTQFDGIVGFEVFARFVIKIDYVHRKLTFIRPRNFARPPAGTRFTFSSIDRIPSPPEVKGSVDGITGRFFIDTGSRGPLTLRPKFVKENNLMSRYNHASKATVGWGIGGSVEAYVTCANTLMFGNAKIQNPVTELMTGGTNRHGGLIGGEILKHFTVIFDYPDERIYFKPNKKYSTLINYNRSGMWVNVKERNFVVKSVMQGGPADKAGLKAGDMIIKVNGKPTSALTLSKLRQQLRDNKPGTSMVLTVGQGQARHKVTIVLRRLIPAACGLEKTS